MPTHNGTASKANLPPNQTLYLTNLPEKLRKLDLRISLYNLFSTYGPVLDVVAMSGSKMRGQAHVAFRDPQASTQAMRALQGFDFFGKSMTISYARGKSDAIAKLDGTYRIPVPAGTGAASSDIQHAIFGAPPTGLPTNLTASQAGGALHSNGAMDAEDPEKNLKGLKRGRDEESDDEGVAMDEDSDAPMEASSDEDE